MFLNRGKGSELTNSLVPPYVIQLSEDSETELQAFTSPIYERPDNRNNKEKQTTNLHCKIHSPQLTCREVFGFAAAGVDETQCSLVSLFPKLRGAQANSQVKSIYFFTLLQQQRAPSFSTKWGEWKNFPKGKANTALGLNLDFKKNKNQTKPSRL